MTPSGRAAPTRPRVHYRHFCPAARALEVIGEKWSLLIVRDLLAGPRRFSDLGRSLTAITPKWLSARLRALEQDGIVAREPAGQREVWYRLTAKGAALAPVIDALVVWGVEHALGGPRRGEAIHPGRAIDAAVRYLERRSVRPAHPVAWRIHFDSDRTYTIHFDGARWSRHRGEAVDAARDRGETTPDVVVHTSPEGWVRFLAADADARRRWLRSARARGTARRLDELAAAFGRPA